MKNDPRRTALDLGGSPPAKRPLASHPVDYTAMKAGQSAGQRKVVRVCPECRRNCIEMHNDVFLIFVHAEDLQPTPKGNVKRKVITQCKKRRHEKQG
jgi:hypothetical protein